MKLVDANVWLPAAWGKHIHHDRAKAWFEAETDLMAFCRVTELAFLRLISTPAIVGDDALSRRQAWDSLLALQADPRVIVLEEPRGVLPLWMAFSKRDDRSHLLWTDDYLAAFAQATGCELITFDAAFRTRYPSVDVMVLRP